MKYGSYASQLRGLTLMIESLQDKYGVFQLYSGEDPQVE
jgi:hypothetical protein